MNVEKLVRMANHIAENLDYGPDKDKVVSDTADHLQRFWTPQMRRLIVEHHSRGNTDLSALAGRAVALLGERNPGLTREAPQGAAQGLT